MIDTTDFLDQWLNVPEDLPPVDEDDLNNLTSFGPQVDRLINHQKYEPSSGLLLAGPNAPQVVDTFDAITDAAEIAWDSSPPSVPYANWCPPDLSPDCSPFSFGSSTPLLRTPLTDPLPATIANIGVWENGAEATRDTIFVDQLGNSLEDDPSQVPNLMPEDVVCIPQTIYSTGSPNTPSVVISPPHREMTLHPDDSVPLIDCSSRASISPLWQSLFMYSPYCPEESSLSGNPPSPSLSPLSTLSVLSTPNAHSSYLPPVDYSFSPSAPPPAQVSDRERGVELTSTPRSAMSANLRGRRNTRAVDEDATVFEMPRRSKAKKRDEEEWNPTSGRVKRPRVAAFTPSVSELDPSTPSGVQDGSEPDKGSEGSSDATHMCCEYCGQSFTRASDRIRHMENSANHPETRKMWPCPYCDSVLGRKDALGRHIRTLHRGEPVLLQAEGVPERRLPGSAKETFMQRMGQRKINLRRQPRRDVRTRNR